MAWRLLHGLVLASAAAAIASIQPRGLVEASGDLYGYDFEFGSEHGFGSGLLEKPQITPMTVEILKEEADAGSRDAQYFYGLVKYYGEATDKELPTAAKYFRKAATQGHKEAAINIALMYYNGMGVPKNDHQAYVWFQRSAESNQPDAQWMLGQMYYDGRAPGGVNFDEARKWFLKSAEQGNPKGCFYMGMLSEYGLGVPNRRPDFAAAMEYYEQAAAQEDPRAMYNMGLMYLDGRGDFNVDFTRASMYFELAAKQEHGPAMYFLGIMHMNGEGFPVDYDRALTWFNMAATTNDMTIRDQAREAVEFLSASMAEARMTMQIIRNKFDPQHADFDPDFERGRPYKVVNPASQADGPLKFIPVTAPGERMFDPADAAAPSSGGSSSGRGDAGRHPASKATAAAQQAKRFGAATARKRARGKAKLKAQQEKERAGGVGGGSAGHALLEDMVAAQERLLRTTNRGDNGEQEEVEVGL